MVIFLETAELRAKNKQETRMIFWKQNIDQIITISHELMEERTAELYLAFDQQRKKQEVAEADQHDVADLKAMEN